MTRVPGAIPAGSPTPSVSRDEEDPGLTLCLSGGGFRATVFHLGALRRLNELGVLARAAVICSVSGGSILNGILATRWQDLKLDRNGTFINFDEVVASATRRFCRRDLRTRLLVGERLNPVNWGILLRDSGSVRANFLALSYETLFDKQRLAELPAPAPLVPRFIFCATSVQTGACWHFHGGPEGRMGDFYTGYSDVGRVQVSEAVAASSAFPPGFGALRLALPADTELSRVDPWGRLRPIAAKRRDLPGGSKRLVLLTDGGVYDNLGVEPIWSRSRALLVSDAGRPFESVPNCHQSLFLRLRRAFEISAEQVGAVRKRWLIAEFLGGQRVGAIWAINTQLEEFRLRNAQGYCHALRDLFPVIRTDLNAFEEAEIACLENHGYSIADAALRSRAGQFCTRPKAEFCWPHPDYCQGEIVERALSRSRSRRFFHDLWAILRGARLIPSVEWSAEVQGDDTSDRYLDQKFAAEGLNRKIKTGIRVTVPISDRQIEVPYGFQNGRFNLIQLARFRATDPQQAKTTACRYAVEGQSLYENPDSRLGQLQLVVLGQFGANQSDSRFGVERILKEHHVRLFTTTEIDRLVDEIRQSAKDLPEATVERKPTFS